MALRAFVAKTTEDKEALYRLRYNVFTGEQSKYTAIADHAAGRLVDAFDDAATHIAVADDEKIVGGLRQIRGRRYASAAMADRLGLDQLSHLKDEEIGFSGRLCIQPRYRGSRALLHLLERNYCTARDDGVRFDFIFCNPHIIEQYEALGYRRYYRYYSDAQLGFQSPMVLDGCAADFLMQVRSPFAKLAHSRPSEAADLRVNSMLMSNIRVGRELAETLMGRPTYCASRAVQAVLRRLLDGAVLIECSAGDVVTPIGTPGREIFLVVSGNLTSISSDMTSTALTAGDFFGHGALLRRGSHDTEVRAAESAEIAVFSDRQVELLARQDPGLVDEFVAALQMEQCQSPGASCSS